MLLSMGKGEEALDQMKTFMKKYVKPNTLYAETGPVFETPMAAVSTLHDFYLQDWGNRIRVFHGMPSLWRDAAFSGLRAQGAFLVSATCRQDLPHTGGKRERWSLPLADRDTDGQCSGENLVG